MAFGGSIRLNPLGIGILAFVFILIVWFNMGGKPPSSSAELSGRVSMKQLLAVAIQTAKRGGIQVKNVRESADIGESSKGKTKEGANNPVTDGDMLSHRIMYNTILKAFPHMSVISEEDDPQKVDMNTIEMPQLWDPEVNQIVKEDFLVPVKDIDVWIDPLDATQEYTENLLQYVTTMVCVAVKGKPVMGVIHKPFNEPQTAWGWVGPNAVSEIVAQDVEKNHPKDHKDLSKSRIIVSRSHSGKVHDVADDAFGKEVNVTSAGGAGYKTWEVIKGVQDAYVHVTLIKKWDICAGDAILRSLGGKLTTLNGMQVDYSGRPAEVKNEGGVLATMHDHQAYLEALKDAKV